MMTKMLSAMPLAAMALIAKKSARYGGAIEKFVTPGVAADVAERLARK